MSESKKPSRPGAREVLLVGSMPFSSRAGTGSRPDATEVFELVTEHLGSHMPCIPDGEQLMWVLAVGKHLVQHPALEVSRLVKHYEMPIEMPVFKLTDGATIDDVVLGPYGYADNAISSYEQFTHLRDAGKVLEGTRLQVTLPSPATTVFAVEVPKDELRPAAVAALTEEQDRIVASIPARDLTIQWDLAAEAGGEQGRRHPEWPVPFEGLEIVDDLSSQLDALAHLADRVPAEVELGFHLCTVGARDYHVASDDTAVVCEIMNTLTDRIERPISYFHIAVPSDRDDAEFFAPLKELAIAPETKLYLGLIYMADGVEGAKRRIEAAESAISGFGVGAQCGLMHMNWDDIPEMLDLHWAVAGA